MRYKVTCDKCKNSDLLVIDEQRNIYWKPTNHIISGRYRLDNQWGFQCACGNYDITTAQERKEIKNLASPDSSEIARILKNIIPDKSKFIMETA